MRRFNDIEVARDANSSSGEHYYPPATSYWNATLISRTPNSSESMQALTMAIFAQNPEAATEMLAILEHPWQSFRNRPLLAQLALGMFLAIYLPLMVLLATIWDILWHVPYKLLYRRRHPLGVGDDRVYWEAVASSSHAKAVWLFLLRDEFVDAFREPPDLAETKSSRTARSFGWSTRTLVSWMSRQDPDDSSTTSSVFIVEGV